MSARRRVRPIPSRFADDTGASLIIALIIVTVVAIVTASTLFFADTGVRTTINLRDQASVQYQASNAINAAIEKLRAAPAGANLGCAEGMLTGAYPALGTAPAGSYRVNCAETADSQSGFLTGANNGPGTALLAVGGNITINAKTTVRINGGIFASDKFLVSNSNVSDIWPNGQAVTGSAKSWVMARNGGNCALVNLTNGASRFDVDCNRGTVADIRGLDPGTLVPAGSTTYTQPPLSGTSSISACKNNVVTVTPGTVDVSQLNAITLPKQCNLVHFEPGTYYFASGVWAPQAGYYVAGTWAPGFDYLKFKAPSGNNAIDISDACIPPVNSAGIISPGAGAGSGVEFVFAPGASFNPNVSANPGVHMAICASPTIAPIGGPPIAIFGDTASTGPQAIMSTQNCPKCDIALLGTVYAPSRDFIIGINNNSAKAIAFGIVARTITFDVAANVGTDMDLAGGMPQAGGSAIPVRYQMIRAYICPDHDTCPASGTPELTVKVAITGYINRTVNIISWSPSH